LQTNNLSVILYPRKVAQEEKLYHELLTGNMKQVLHPKKHQYFSQILTFSE